MLADEAVAPIVLLAPGAEAAPADALAGQVELAEQGRDGAGTQVEHGEQERDVAGTPAEPGEQERGEAGTPVELAVLGRGELVAELAQRRADAIAASAALVAGIEAVLRASDALWPARFLAALPPDHAAGTRAVADAVSVAVWIEFLSALRREGAKAGLVALQDAQTAGARAFRSQPPAGGPGKKDWFVDGRTEAASLDCLYRLMPGQVADAAAQLCFAEFEEPVAPLDACRSTRAQADPARYGRVERLAWHPQEDVWRELCSWSPRDGL